MRICIKIIFHLSKLWKAKFSLLCDVIFLVRLQGKFDIDHSQEWKGYGDDEDEDDDGDNDDSDDNNNDDDDDDDDDHNI